MHHRAKPLALILVYHQLCLCKEFSTQAAWFGGSSEYSLAAIPNGTSPGALWSGLALMSQGGWNRRSRISGAPSPVSVSTVGAFMVSLAVPACSQDMAWFSSLYLTCFNGQDMVCVAWSMLRAQGTSVSVLLDLKTIMLPGSLSSPHKEGRWKRVQIS